MNESLMILITCRELALREGSQLYTRDVALRLKELGHRPAVFSPDLGEVAEEVRGHGIPVISDLDQLGQQPDVIHGQHHLETVAASLRFPNVPAIFVCHGWLPWQEAPPRLPSIRRYVAVDETRRDRMVLEHGVPPEKVELIHNFVDLDRFLPRAPVTDKPNRALLFSNQATEHNFGAVVRLACALRNIPLDIAGHDSGRVVDQPERLLADYDLVFARGRSAMEAMAVGAGVVLCDIEGFGSFVESSNFTSLRNHNFGVAALRSSLNAEELGRQIDRFSSIEVLRVQQLVRSLCGRNEAVDQLLTVYRAAMSGPDEVDPKEMLTAASRYLSWLGPFTERWMTEAVRRADRVHQTTLEREELRRVEFKIRSLEDDLTVQRGYLEDANESLRVLQESPFSRVRARLLDSPFIVRIYRLMRGQGRAQRRGKGVATAAPRPTSTQSQEKD